MRYAIRQIKPSNLVFATLLLIGSCAYVAGAKSQSNIDDAVGALPKPNANPQISGKETVRLNAVNATSIASAVDMSAVKRVQLRVLNYADLSGEFSIESNHTLSLPGVGRIRVDGRTPSEIEAELADKISIYARRDVQVSIEILAYRNYFIMGMIMQPGSNEWQPGLNIIKAIALARGTVRQPTATDDPLASLSLQQSRTQLQFSLALLARLKAERDGADIIQNEQQISSVMSNMPAAVRPRLQDFVDRQSEILSEQRRLTTTQITGLEEELSTAQSELNAAIAQEKAIKDQHDISGTLLKDIEQLKNKRLVANSRYLEQRSELLSSQIRFAESQSLTERARARVANITRQIVTLKAQQRMGLNDRIESLQREVAQLELTLLQSSSGGGEGVGNKSNLSYSIARHTASGIVTFDANVFSEIKPGDVIVVSSGINPENEMQAAPRSEMSNAAETIQRAIESSSTAQTVPGRSGRGTSVVQ